MKTEKQKRKDKLKKLEKLSQEYKFDLGESTSEYLVIKSHMCCIKVSKQKMEEHRKSKVTLKPKDFDLVEHGTLEGKKQLTLRKQLKREYKVTEILFDDFGNMVVKSKAQETKVEFKRED